MSILIVLMIVFLIFASNTSTYVVRKANRKKGKNKKLISFSSRYWPVILFIVLIFILSRYIYELVSGTIGGSSVALERFIGLYGGSYSFIFSLGLTKFDFADNSILWVLFLFLTL